MALLGIDLGTSSVKALLIDEQGTPLASATVEYPLSAPKPLWSEQDPADWWRGTGEAVRAVMAKAGLSAADVRGIGLSGQMHGLTLLDKEGQVLRPAILWNDQRTGPQCETITQLAGGKQRVLELTANVVLPGFTAPKLLWVRENEPDIYARVAHVLLPKDYIRYKLSGEFATEVSDASGMSVFDVRNRTWSDEMLRILDIPRAWMPRCAESHEVTASVSQSAAQELGLQAGTPIVGGGGDNAAAAVGNGIVREGVVSASIGTSGVVFASSEHFVMEPEGNVHAFCHALPQMWHVMGVMLSAGGSLRWHRDVIAYGDPALTGRRTLGSDTDPYDIMLAQAAHVPAGAEGLLFLPYLTGERCPYPDPLARGAFVGLTIRHTQAHLTRAVVEGITFGLADSLALVRGLGIPIHEVRAVGGGARSAFWRQLMADVFQTEITLINSAEGAAFGVALLAGVGIGIWRTAREACDATLKVTTRVEPTRDSAVRNRYADMYARYRELYPALKNTFAQLST
ncbi:MAG: xylulokinase [Anaerolineae bacterium]|nr:xylulokinase [Thermoflexales bacterium]MDW8407634.1 xylulokinase [Anaerolineae bacterium]